MEEQSKRYALFDKLQALVRNLDVKTQQLLPYDLLASVASSLTDSAIFTIVDHLEEIQHLTEKDLYTKRLKIVNEHKTLRNDLRKSQADDLRSCRPHNLALLKTNQETESQRLEERLDKELKAFDEKLMAEIDNKVVVQQVTLKSAGVPSFFVTTEVEAIRLQMIILNLIKNVGDF